MIAASEEMHEEKLEFSNLIEHLNEVLEPRGIELKRIKWNPETDGSIEEYKAKLKECEMCLTLYWRDLVGNSKEGLDTAYQELKAGNNPRNLYVFFKEPTEDLTETLKDFKANFVTKYGHFFCKFENVDTMNLHFILQFEAYQNHLRIKDDPLVKVAGGKVTVADKEFVNLDNVPFAALNKEYQRLQKELLELDIRITEVRKRHKANPDNEDIEDELMAIKSKRKKQADEFEKYQIHLYDIALNFAKTAGEKYSERMRKARELFELGDVIGADQILNMEEMKRDRLHESEHKKVHEENLEILMNEFLDKTKTVMTNTLFSIPERFGIACEAYEEAKSIAEEIHLDEEKFANILFDYAHLLDEYHRIDKALSYYSYALDLLRKLALTDDTSLYNIACVQNSMANLSAKNGNPQNAEDDYSQAIETLNKTKDDNAVMYLRFTATIYHNRSILQCNLGNYKEAEMGFEIALRIYDTLIESSTEIYLDEKAATLGEMAVLHRKMGTLESYQKAENEYLTVIEIFNQLGKNDSDEYMHRKAGVINNLGVLLFAQERYEEAECKYREALEIREKLAGKNPEVYYPEYAETLNNIGGLCCITGRDNEAEKLFTESLGIWEHVAKAEPKAFQCKIARLKYNLGQLFRKRHSLYEAEQMLCESVDLFRNIGEDAKLYKPDMVNALFMLALTKASLKQFKEARDLSSEALSLFEDMEKTNSGTYSDMIANIQSVLVKLNSLI